MTQFDIIRQQAESAARNAAAGAVGRLRRDTSLVNQASQLTGRAIRKGEAAWKKRGAAGRRRSACGPTVEEAARPTRPGQDGYVRRSPVQPVHQAADYRLRQVLRVVQVIVLIAVVCVGLSLLSQLGVFGR